MHTKIGKQSLGKDKVQPDLAVGISSVLTSDIPVTCQFYVLACAPDWAPDNCYSLMRAVALLLT